MSVDTGRDSQALITGALTPYLEIELSGKMQLYWRRIKVGLLIRPMRFLLYSLNEQMLSELQYLEVL